MAPPAHPHVLGAAQGLLWSVPNCVVLSGLLWVLPSHAASPFLGLMTVAFSVCGEGLSFDRADTAL